MSVDISVVVPMYNTEKFIRACIDSVLAQKFVSFEVIIVDDCTPDNGAALCEELYGQDERVRIIHHEKNGGLGAARDTGTSYATGKYVYYVDSDDEIMPNFLRDMFTTAEEYDADVLHNTRIFSVVPNEGEPLPLEMLDIPEDSLFSFSPDHDELTEITVLNDDMEARLVDWEHHRYHFSAWGSMYKLSFLRENNITFNKMRFTEDTVFYFQCLFNARKFVVRPGGGYLYRITDSSLSRGKKTPDSAVKAMRAQLDITEKMQLVSKRIPFFRDSESNTQRAIDALLLSLEDGFVKPAFQSLGEEGMRSGESVHKFFADNFGENAPYVEFLFYELHKIYAPVIDFVGASGNPDELRRIIKK